MEQEQLEAIRKQFRHGEYAISDHAIIEARKDGIVPQTMTKLEWVAIHGKIIEEYPERERMLLYAEVPDELLPIHIIIEYSFPEEPVIVTAYIPDSQYWIKSQIRKSSKRRKP